MKTLFFPSSKLGMIKNQDFTGYWLFSNGQKNTGRLDRFGSILVFNDDYINPRAHIGMHPHKNTEVVTVMIDGMENHRDSLHNYHEVQASSVQVISSGRGIYHSGGNLSKDKKARHLQIWIAPEVQDTPPEVQLRTFNPIDRINKWDLQLAPVQIDNSLVVKQKVWLSRGSFLSGEFEYKTHLQGNDIALFVIDGLVEIGGKEIRKQGTIFIYKAQNFHFKVKSPSDLFVMEVS